MMNRKGKTMIEITAKVEELDREKNEAGVGITCRMEGTGEELLHEALSSIRAITNNLKRENEWLHMVLLQEIATDTTVLFGEDYERDKMAAELASLNSKSIIKKGVN